MSKKILLVEDEKDISSAFKKQLSLIGGYEVDIANGGKEALEKLSKNKYGLVLLDLAMPHIDGITVLERLKIDSEKKEPNYCNPPIIILTNVTSEETQKELEEFEIKDYIIKSSIRNKELLEKVKSIIKK